MKVLSVADFLSVMNLNNYKVFTSQEKNPYNLNIIGVRNKHGRLNHFDDSISIYWEWKGKWFERHYEASTLPGTIYLINPVNQKGTAILVPGQYIGAYEIGLHKGRYSALIQVEPVQVYRDRDRDNMPEESSFIDTGLFGINIHKASFVTRLVGPSSAGCQVFKKSADFEQFMEFCELARGLWGNSFTYTLVSL